MRPSLDRLDAAVAGKSRCGAGQCRRGRAGSTALLRLAKRQKGVTLKAPVSLLGHQETGRQQAARGVEAEVAIELEQPPARDETQKPMGSSRSLLLRRQSDHARRSDHAPALGAEEPRCRRRSWRRALPQPDRTGHVNTAILGRVSMRRGRSPRAAYALPTQRLVHSLGPQRLRSWFGVIARQGAPGSGVSGPRGRGLSPSRARSAAPPRDAAVGRARRARSDHAVRRRAHGSARRC